MLRKAQGCGYKNEFGSWAQDFRCYKQLTVVSDMNYFESWAHNFGCYEQVKVVDDINDSWSYGLSPLDAMSSSRLWIIRIVLGHELMDLNAMSNWGL